MRSRTSPATSSAEQRNQEMTMTGERHRATGGSGRRRSWLTTAALLTAAISLPAGGLTVLSATTAAAATPVQIGKAPVLPHGTVRAGAPAAGTTLSLDVQ